MGIWESEEYMDYCKVCKKQTEHKVYNYNDDKGDEVACLEHD